MAEASKQAAPFVAVKDAGALEELFARSNQSPVLLFKHSTTCPISDAGAAGEVALVVVQTARPLSNEIAERTGVRHESPQAIVLRAGKPVWTASHYDITAAAVEQAVRENE
jgi:bacillithiol system protein YtxJ